MTEIEDRKKLDLLPGNLNMELEHLTSGLKVLYRSVPLSVYHWVVVVFSS